MEIPSESQVLKLVSANEDWYRKQMGNSFTIYENVTKSLNKFYSVI